MIEVKESGIHNHGVFATQDICKGTKVIEYVGEIISKDEADRRADLALEKSRKEGCGAVYIFELDEEHDIDGDVPYNKAKFINHSCSPNCETENIDNHIWIIAIKDIKKGEELSYDYGYGIDDYKDHPCRCGSENCVGYIVGEEHIPKLQKILRKK